MKPTFRYLKATNTTDLLNQVREATGNGEDLYQPLFVSHEGLLCQSVVAIHCMYEYKLIVAFDLYDLELQIQNLTDLGYDYMFHVVLWEAKYLQWMCRMNDGGLTVRDAVVKLSAGEVADVYLGASREDELRLVEDVRAGLRMAPAAEDAYTVTLPFPLRLS